MTFEPSPRQALVLWSLVVAAPGEEPSRSTVKPKLSPAERKQMLSAAFIEEEKRGRSTHLILAEQGWAWAEQQRQIRLSPSPSAAAVLEKLIRALAHYRNQYGVPLAEVIFGSPSSSVRDMDIPRSSSQPSLADQIRNACLMITGGEYERRVRLADLRRELVGIHRETLDEELRKMDRFRQIELMALEQAAQITQQDREAALMIAGRPMHVVYLAR